MDQTAYTHEETVKFMRLYEELVTAYVAISHATNLGQKTGGLRANLLQARSNYDLNVPRSVRDSLSQTFTNLEKIISNTNQSVPA